LASTLGPVIRVSGGGSNKFINLTRSSVIAAPGGQWLNATGGGNVTITASDATTLTGAAVTVSGIVSSLTLSNPTTVWNMTGTSNVTNLTINASTINFTPPVGDPMQLSSYKTLTTNRFTGAGGEINMNTFLGADGSPSDQIVITGTASSTTPTSLMFHNTGGPGLETTGNGIQVVRADGVGGTTAANTFVLNGEARAGAFDYFLFRGGLNPTNQPNDWFLRSSFIVGPIPPEPPIPPIIPPIPPEPPPGVLPPGVVFPIIGPELATYGVVQ